MRRSSRAILFGAITALGLQGLAEATTVRATTSVAVRVERHAGIVLPAPATSRDGLLPASFSRNRSAERPVVIGNAAPALIATASEQSGWAPTQAPSRAAPVELIVFEP